MGRAFLWTAGIAALFLTAVFCLLLVMPGPHKSSDYLVIGALATLVCLVAAFVAASGVKDTFYKRRR